MATIEKQPIPLTVLGGYLGAGKTTLLNRMLRENDGRRLAVIVNDFGSINIDAELIENQDGETINLANGCICCSLADGLATTLISLLHLPTPPDQIVIEASGVADPTKMGQYGYFLGFRLDGVIVLADAEQIREKSTDKYVGETVIRQLKGADLVVLNKVDLVTPEALADVHAWLVNLEPQTRILETSYGQIPMEFLLGLREDRSQPVDSMLAHEGSDQKHSRHDHEHQKTYQTWSFISQEPIHEADVRALADNLPEGVLRAKGFVCLKEDSERQYLLQLVGKRWSLTPTGSWGERQPETRLVFIGISGTINEKHFEAALTGE